MRFFLLSVDIVLAISTLQFAAYLALLTLAAMFSRHRPTFAVSPSQRRFAILVPAHDEEAVIGKTLKYLLALEYPQSQFDIIVIADNCSDSTASIARSARVNVFERIDSVNTGKGHALRWCLDRLSEQGKIFDAFVFIDADTLASPNLLSVMDAHLQRGADCIQCSDLVASQPGAWSPEVTRIAFLLHNFVRPLGKMAFGLSASLNGSGMCLSKELIAAMPWTSYSRVEDLEYALELALRGVRVDFAPEATIYTAMPSESKAAESQRRRWEIARFAVVKRYVRPLFLAAVRKRSVMILDMFFELVTPALVNLCLFTCAMIVIHTMLVVLGVDWLAGMGWIFASALVLEGFHVLGGLFVARATGADYGILVNIPRYAFWKLLLYFRTILHGDDKAWIRTQRSNRYAA